MKSEQIKEITEKATEQLVAVLRAYFVPLFGNAIAEDIKPLDSQRWLKSLHESNGLAWTTISKMRSIMYRIYKIRILYEHVTKNPVQHVETRSKSDYKAIVITPAQTLATLKALPSLLHFTLVLTCAATALRASQILVLRAQGTSEVTGQLSGQTRRLEESHSATDEWIDPKAGSS
jgi:site-specific recombinase XerD